MKLDFKPLIPLPKENQIIGGNKYKSMIYLTLLSISYIKNILSVSRGQSEPLLLQIIQNVKVSIAKKRVCANALSINFGWLYPLL